jgi:hypothetical protein
MKFARKIILLMGILLIPLCVFFAPRLIKIDTINCNSQYDHCSELINADLDSLSKGSLYTTKKAVESSLKNEFLVKDFQINFKVPGTLEVDVVEKKPKFSLAKSDKSMWALVDKDGYVLSFSDSSNLPGIISASPLPAKGDPVNGRYLFAMNIMYDLFSLYQIKEGSLSEDSLVIELPDGLRVIFPLEGNRQELVGEFMLLYNEIERANDNPKLVDGQGKVHEIDLRFKNPILR